MMQPNKTIIMKIFPLILISLTSFKAFSAPLTDQKSIHLFVNGMPDEFKVLPQYFVEHVKESNSSRLDFLENNIGKVWTNFKPYHSIELDHKKFSIDQNINEVKIFKDKDDLAKIFIKVNVTKENTTRPEYIVCPLIKVNSSKEIWKVINPKDNKPTYFYKTRQIEPPVILERGYYFNINSPKNYLSNDYNNKKIITDEDVYTSTLENLCVKVELTLLLNKIEIMSEDRLLKWMNLENITN